MTVELLAASLAQAFSDVVSLAEGPNIRPLRGQ
jgi:hypothetical protein